MDRAGRRGRGQHASQIGQSRRRAFRLVKLEPNLEIAAVQVEFGDLILLQELDQLFQILDVLWFHSFLDLPRLRGEMNFQSSIRALGAGVSTCPPVRVTATISSMRTPNWPGR